MTKRVVREAARERSDVTMNNGANGINVEVIVVIRKLAGLTQYTFAERLGVSRSLVARVENFDYPINDNMINAIKREFGAEYVEQVKRFKAVD